MRALSLFFKNGKRIDGLLWTWTPERGVIVVLDEKTGDRVSVDLADLSAGSLFPDRVRDDQLASDLLEEAKAEGWN